MAPNVSQPLYCGSAMDAFHASYKHAHGYISLLVCVMGTIANTLNIIVLTRREMRSPTNAILTGLAIADLAVMIEYVPYTIHDYILADRLPRELQLSYYWVCFIKFHSIFAQVLHTISIWLTVTLAVWRYIAVGYPQKNRLWCSMRLTIITILLAYAVCTLVVSPWLYLVSAIAEFQETLNASGKTISSIPLSPYLVEYQREQKQKGIILFGATTTATTTTATTASSTAFTTSATINVLKTTATTIMPVLAASSSTALPLSTSASSDPPPTASADAGLRNVTVYRLYHSALALHNVTLRNVTFLLYGVLIKLIPCFALTILSVRLIAALMDAKRRRTLLTKHAEHGLRPLANDRPAGVGRPSRKNSKSIEKERQTDRTTRMLLAVLLLFLITEFPQGIMGLLNAILGDAFLMQCYLGLSDVMDVLALINSSINFILYCSMSRQFRTTFSLLFRPKFLDKWLPLTQHSEKILGRNRLLCTDVASKSAMAEQCLTTQVTNV